VVAPITDSPWFIIISTILGGTLASTFVSWYINRQLKKRDEKFEMSKHKMNIMAKSLPIYTRLGSYYDDLSNHLQYSEPDLQRAFFTACKIIQLERSVFETVGTIQLDSLDAEQIITSFELDLNVDYLTRDTMRQMAEKHPTYKEFLEDGFDEIVFKKFKEIFFQAKSKPASADFPNLQQKCSWYCQLMFLEINQVYARWYDDHPVQYVRKLTPDLQKYLMNNYEDYYNRIKNWEIKKLF
jgi:hypothetical protein